MIRLFIQLFIKVTMNFLQLSDDTACIIFESHSKICMQTYNQLKMTHEMATLLKTRAERGVEWWVKHPDPELSSEELLDAMNLFVEAADLYSTIDAGADNYNDPRLALN